MVPNLFVFDNYVENFFVADAAVLDSTFNGQCKSGYNFIAEKYL